ISGAPGQARRSRTASAVASVPDAQKRTRSAQATAATMSSARPRAGSVTYAKLEPRAACVVAAARTAGGACPRSTEPQPMVKSVDARPSLSHTVAPSPRQPPVAPSRGGSTVASSGGRSYAPSDPPGKTARDRSAALVTPRSHAEGVEARDVAAHDQGVDVVGALVGVDRFQVHHVADDRMLV